ARMARDLGLATTAEGIETEGQLALMRGLGFDEGQGFLFGRPMSAAMVRERLARGPSVAAA
ncbi:MAG TPA: EAL domain-containing protein, partial [Beijerinckiaceae bacterium]